MLKLASLDEDTSEFTAKSTFDHPYPTTKIMWIPDSKVLYWQQMLILKESMGYAVSFQGHLPRPPGN